MHMSREDNTRTYKSYKDEKFEKMKARIDRILKGIDDLSLNKKDKEKLLIRVKKQVDDFGSSPDKISIKSNNDDLAIKPPVGGKLDVR